MTGRCGIAVLLGALALAPALPAAPLSGTEVAALIRSAMAAAGEAPARVPAPARPLPDCGHVPAVAPFQTRWSAVELTCAAPPWKRVLRTTARPTATARPAAQAGAPVRPGLVLARPLARGTVLRAADLLPAEVPARAAATIFTTPADLIGRRLRTDLAAQEPLMPRHLEPVYLVHAGTPVSLTATAGGISVTVTVLAQQDGQQGEVIRLRHPVSGRILRATVTGPDSLRLRANIP